MTLLFSVWKFYCQKFVSRKENEMQQKKTGRKRKIVFFNFDPVVNEIIFKIKTKIKANNSSRRINKKNQINEK